MAQAAPLPLSDRRNGSERPVLAASVAVFREGRILLARRARAPMLGLYSLPGGKVEFGEKLEQTALRELGEEVAVVAQIVCFNRLVEVTGSDHGGMPYHFVIATFAARWVSGEGTLGPEVDAISWADPSSVGAFPHTEQLPTIVSDAWEKIRCSHG